MESLTDFLSWAWARHHNPWSWYIRPLFVLPFVWFAYRKSVAGVLVTVLAVLSSTFWFPAPSEADPRAARFLAVERAYVTGGWTWAKTAMTALVPLWFAALAWAFWRRSFVAGLVVINAGALLKVIWSFHYAGGSARSIIPPVLVGALIVNGTLLYFMRRRTRKLAPPTVLLLSILILACGGSGADGSPATFDRAEFRSLAWLEGDWRGTGGQRPFFERYESLNDSTIRIRYFADSTRSAVRGAGSVYHSGGAIYHESDGARWAAVRLDSTGVQFVPDERASNSFRWSRLSPDTWEAVLRFEDGSESRYVLTRIRDGRR